MNEKKINLNIQRKLITYFIIFILPSILLIIVLYKQISESNSKSYYPKAKDGIIDLSDWDIVNDPIISLDGEWLFYPEQLLEFDTGLMTNNDLINVPGLWNSFLSDQEEIGPYGYGTYRLLIILPMHTSDALSIKVPDMSSSYKLFINGQAVCSNGIVGKSRKEETPSWKPLVKTIDTYSNHLELFVQVSNYHHMKGGMWESILIGPEDEINRNRELNLFTSIILVGILFISALYYFIFYSVAHNNTVSLYLALFCLAAAAREFLIREVLALLVFPDFSFSLLSRIEYMTVPLGPIFLTLSLYSLYPDVFPKKVLKFILTPFILYIIIIAITPLYIFGHLMNICLFSFVAAFFYMLFILVFAVKRKKPGSGLLLIGTCIMLINAIIDMGYANNIHNNYGMAYTFSIGFILFILCQMHSFSLMIAEMHERSQKLSMIELAFLQAQIVPHFLFNTLHTIIYLTRESPEKARDLLLEFSNYLRGKFNFKMYRQNLSVPLDHELGLVKSYLSIEMVRFHGRLEVIYHIDEKSVNCAIMPFLLQPLVENAVRHGFKNKTENCKIILSCSYIDSILVISIEDNGVGMSKEKIHSIMNEDTNQKGTGLINVQQRLISTYGSGMNIKSTLKEGTIIIIKIPCKEGNINA